jgi:hypothetical protein
VNLRDLLQSKPDSASPLTGPDLIRRKVKQLVVVGGRFKQSDILQQKYPEYNFGGADPKAAPDTRYVVENWPTTILFAGLEIGQGVCTGPSLAATPPTNPVRRIYELFGSLKNPRSSWCQIAVLAAVRDPHLYWNVKGDGYCQVSPAALNAWSNDLHRGHFYLAMKLSQDAMAKIIGQLMAAPPAAH